MNIIICILIWVLCVPILYLARKNQGQFNPVWLMSLFWVGQMALLPLVGSFFFFQYSGFLFILVAIFCLNIGGLGGMKLALPSESSEHILTICNERRIKVLVITLTLLGFATPILKLLRYGFNLSTLLNLNMLLQMNNAVAVDRYTQHEQFTLTTQLLLVFTYVAPLYAGFVHPLVKERHTKILCKLAIAPAIFVALTQAVKMALITSVFLWFSGLLTSSVLIGKQYTFNLKKILTAILGVLVLFGILFTSMMFRTGHWDANTAVTIEHKFVTYALGHVPAFDLWYDAYDELSAMHGYGVKTFYGISNYLGIAERKQGVFQEMITIDSTHSHTNVYTIFRLLIDDFGIIGACIYLFAIGIFMTIAYRMAEKRTCMYAAVTILSASYFSVSWSFGTSVFAYTSYIVMFLVFYVLTRLTIK